MAYASTDTHLPLPNRKARFGAPLQFLKGLLDAFVNAQRYTQRIERLMQLSDEQLAARGLSRDGIVQHVMGQSIDR